MGVGRQVLAAETTAPVGGYPTVTFEGLRHAGANIGLATMFFVAAIPGGGAYHLNHLGDAIWSVGMILTGVFCVMRPRPSAVMLDWRAMASGLGAFVLPALMSRTNLSTSGFTYQTAIVFESVGVTLSQVARVYMGHAFAVLPANRGIVSGGPFRVVRHPVYLGWILLAMGFSMAYPSFWNLALLAACMALTFWRIHLEEELLGTDPDYRDYLSRVHYRMIPGVY
jgi:protein-S-isoprenylcysteine O-methyltransferase Ste14